MYRIYYFYQHQNDDWMCHHFLIAFAKYFDIFLLEIYLTFIFCPSSVTVVRWEDFSLLAVRRCLCQSHKKMAKANNNANTSASPSSNSLKAKSAKVAGKKILPDWHGEDAILCPHFTYMNI